MKKILIFIPTLGEGGAERVLITLVNNLNREKYNITVQSIFNEGINKNKLEPHITYKFNFPKLIKGYTQLFKLFSPKILYKLFIKEEYDILISYLEGPTTRILSGADTTKKKILNWVHIEVENKRKFTRSYRSESEFITAISKYDYNIFVSETAKKSLESNFNDLNFEVNLVKYNSVDSNEIIIKSREDIEIDFKEDVINLISVGRFTEQKGYNRLLSIVKSLKEKKIKFHLYLLGKGELEKNYLDYISKNELEANVTIVGFKENPHKYVSKADLFVCSSYREGYSTVVTESLIVGTPVITTMCSGMVELLGAKNEYGVITENDERALGAKLEELIVNKELLNHYKERAAVRGRDFNLNQTVKAVEELLDK